MSFEDLEEVREVMFEVRDLIYQLDSKLIKMMKHINRLLYRWELIIHELQGYKKRDKGGEEKL